MSLAEDTLHRSLDNATAAATNTSSFAFECPLHVFEKADAPQGKTRRIGGLISTETPDRQGETILQDGLDFADFIGSGWYNDNHTKDTAGILGYPETVRQFKRGEILPDGTVAPTNATWAEGYLLNTKKADEIWELGNALKETGRRLGFSVEGAILKRRGTGNRIIAKARVRNVAITNCPVNTDARLEVLARSLAAIELENAEILKSLTVGPTGGANVPVDTSVTGAGAGQILATEDLEKPLRVTTFKSGKRKIKKSLSDAEAIAWVMDEVPGTSFDTAQEFVALTKALKGQGIL